MEPFTEGGWSGNASGNYPITHKSPSKIVWLIVGRATILREDVLEKNFFWELSKLGEGETPLPKLILPLFKSEQIVQIVCHGGGGI